MPLLLQLPLLEVPMLETEADVVVIAKLGMEWSFTMGPASHALSAP